MRQRHGNPPPKESFTGDKASLASTDGSSVGLKKRVGLVSGIALIVGTMIGEGLL